MGATGIYAPQDLEGMVTLSQVQLGTGFCLFFPPCSQCPYFAGCLGSHWNLQLLQTLAFLHTLPEAFFRSL